MFCQLRIFPIQHTNVAYLIKTGFATLGDTSHPMIPYIPTNQKMKCDHTLTQFESHSFHYLSEVIKIHFAKLKLLDPSENGTL